MGRMRRLVIKPGQASRRSKKRRPPKEPPCHERAGRRPPRSRNRCPAQAASFMTERRTTSSMSPRADVAELTVGELGKLAHRLAVAPPGVHLVGNGLKCGHCLSPARNLCGSAPFCCSAIYLRRFDAARPRREKQACKLRI